MDSLNMRRCHGSCSIEVAEHNFQVPMPNSPLLFNYLRFGARFFFLQESRLTTGEFILALRCVLLPWQRD